MRPADDGEATMSQVEIPSELLPEDGRFGCGPSRVSDAAIARLATLGRSVLGTSHRQRPVQDEVAGLRDGIARLFRIPDGHEVLITVGGATAFWDAAVFGLIEQRSQHYVFGEFSSKFATAARRAPWLDEPLIVEAEPGTRPAPVAAPEGVDLHAWTHNETSTGVMQDIRRIDDALCVVDATSAAGGLPVDIDQTDVYYFSLQKGFAADGGLTVAIVSPRAIERIERIVASGRYIPAFLDLATVVENSRKDQTYNTPAIATVVLARAQVEAMLAEHGDLAGVVVGQRQKADHLYTWAETRPWARPFVGDPDARSLVVATVDLDGVDADAVNAALRANGIVDTESYRKLGRNQLRIGFFPAVPLSDIEAFTACVDHVVERIA
jgi:phosphoserine aminotransferase